MRNYSDHQRGNPAKLSSIFKSVGTEILRGCCTQGCCIRFEGPEGNKDVNTMQEIKPTELHATSTHSILGA
jgi:hypothetical protein